MKLFDYGFAMHGAGDTRDGLPTETKPSQSERDRQRRGIAAAVVMFAINAVLASCLVAALYLFAVMYAPWAFIDAASSEGGNEGEISPGQSRLDTMETISSALANVPVSSAQTLRGILSEQVGDFDSALAAYAWAVELSPTPATHHRFANIAHRMGRWDEALNSYRLALAGQGFETAWAKEGYFRALLESGKRKAATEAIHDFGWRDTKIAYDKEIGSWRRTEIDYCKKNALNISFETQALVASVTRPGEASCLLEVGRSLTADGFVNLARLALLAVATHSKAPEKKKEAKAFLKRRLPPQNVSKLAESLNIVGYNLQFVFQDHARAITTYKKSIAADPDFPWPYSNIGNTLKQRGQFEQSLPWFEKALKTNPNYFRALRHLGWVLFKLDRHEEAREAFARAIRLGPDDAFSHAKMGRLSLEMGDKAVGLRELRLAVKLDPTRTEDKRALDYWLGVDARRGPTPGLAL